MATFSVPAKLRKTFRELSGSLAFWPSMMCALGVALGVLMPTIDGWLARGDVKGVAWALIRFETEPGVAQGLLSTAAGTLATVLGVVFSLTIVTLQAASVQYTPRLLRRFVSDRTTQGSLGAYLGTVIYLFMILRAVRAGEHLFVPQLSVSLGILLVIFCLMLLAYFLHHLAHSIQAGSLIAEVGRETTGVLDHYPRSPGAFELAREPPSGGVPVRANRAGYLQIVDEDQLLRAAEGTACTITIRPRIGDFILPGDTLVSVFAADPLDASRVDRLRDAFALGSSRSIEEDALFGVRQLVDLALKALSPGVNDVTTAFLTVNELGMVCLHAARNVPEQPLRERREGQVRVLANGFEFRSLLFEALAEIPSAAKDQPRVIARIAELLSTIHSGASVPVKAATREALGWLRSATHGVHYAEPMRSVLEERLCKLEKSFETGGPSLDKDAQTDEVH